MLQGEIYEVYREDTSDRRYHTPTLSSKPKLYRKETPKEVISYNMYQPMDYDTFTKLSVDAQIKYLRYLHSEYMANGTDIREMLQISKTTFCTKVIKRLGLTGLFERGKKMPYSHRKKWEEFIGYNSKEEPVSCEKDDNIDTVDVANTAYSMSTMSTTMTLKGEMNASEILSRISSLIPDGTQCSITINIERMNDV